MALIKKILKPVLSHKEQILAFFTLLAFLMILILTWVYFSKSQDRLQNNEKTHTWIQNEFQKLLSDWVEQKHPEISSITFHKVWTKDTKTPTDIKIFFNYSLVTKGESGGTADLTGSALLKRASEQQWEVQDFEINKNLIDFSQALVIQAPSPKTPSSL